MSINYTRETLDLTKQSLKSGQPLHKGVTLASGLTWFDLQAPAKNIYPVITPLRNSIPRVHRVNASDAARWRQVTALTGSGYDAMGWVPEGQRSGTMSYATAQKSASYVTIGEEDYLTFEAEAAAQGLEDENSMVTLRLLQKMMRKEEIGLLAGNASLSLGTPSTPTPSASGSGATLPTATYSVIVVALTLEGWKNASLAGGVATANPAQGQYAVSGGTYSFAAADANAGVLISYSYVPADIGHACMELVGERYRYKNRIGEASKSLGGQETMAFSQKDMPDFIRTLLQPYKRVILA